MFAKNKAFTIMTIITVGGRIAEPPLQGHSQTLTPKFQAIDKQTTRVTPTNKSAIDLIFVSDPQKVYQSGAVTFGVSDHFLTYCTRKNTKQISHKTIKIRYMKKFTPEKFQSMLKNVEWDDVFNCENVEKAWNVFKRFLLSVIDEIASIKQIRVGLKQRMNHGSMLKKITDS